MGAAVAAVDVAAGSATVGLTAVAPSAASLCANTIEPAHNGKATTALNAHPTVGLFMAAVLTSGVMGFMIKGYLDESTQRATLEIGFIPTIQFL